MYDTSMVSVSLLETVKEEYETQLKMLNEKLGFYEAKIRRLECELRLKKSNDSYWADKKD